MSNTQLSQNFEIYFCVIQLSNEYRTPLVTVRVDEGSTLEESVGYRAARYIAEQTKIHKPKKPITVKNIIHRKIYYKQYDGQSQNL